VMAYIDQSSSFAASQENMRILFKTLPYTNTAILNSLIYSEGNRLPASVGEENQ